VTGELVTALGEARRWNARVTGLVAVAEKRGLARKQGYPSTTEWLMALSGEPAAACRSKVAVASALEEMPATREAFAAGALPESRVKVLAQAQALCPDQFAQDEAALVAQVAAASPKQVPRVLAEWKRNTDPVGAEAEAERLFGQRALHLCEDWSGMLRLSGLLDPESGGVVQAAIRSLAEPANLDPQDTRTPAQRQADALAEIARRYLDGTPGMGSSRPHLSVTVPWDTLQQAHGLVDIEVGPIPAETARRLACDANVSRIIVDKDGVPVSAGQARRTVPPPLRRALDLRDGHCTHPGCDIPARWCDAHHIVHWAHGGRTELANLHLLCRLHHRTAHNHQPYPRRE